MAKSQNHQGSGKQKQLECPHKVPFAYFVWKKKMLFESHREEEKLRDFFGLIV